MEEIWMSQKERRRVFFARAGDGKGRRLLHKLVQTKNVRMAKPDKSILVQARSCPISRVCGRINSERKARLGNTLSQRIIALAGVWLRIV